MKAVVVQPGAGHRVGNVEFLARSADTPRFNLALITIQPHRERPAGARPRRRGRRVLHPRGRAHLRGRGRGGRRRPGHVRARPAGGAPHVREPRRRARADGQHPRPGRLRPAGWKRTRRSSPGFEARSRGVSEIVLGDDQDRSCSRAPAAYAERMSVLAEAQTVQPAPAGLRRWGGARPVTGIGAVAVAGILAVTLPLIGFVSLLLREQLDPQLHNHQAHFVIFGARRQASRSRSATRRARRPTGAGTPASCSSRWRSWRQGASWASTPSGPPASSSAESRAGFQIAIPVGLLVAAFFAAGSAFVDLRPELGPWLIRRRGQLRAAVLTVMGVWFLWTLANLPPLRGPNSEAATGRVLAASRDRSGRSIYAVSAARYWRLFRRPPHAALDRRDRLFPAARRGDDRRRRHGRAQVARELVGVARPDRPRLLDHRLRRPPRVARGALPEAVPADDARAPPGDQRPLRRPRRLHELLRAVVIRPRSRRC